MEHLPRACDAEWDTDTPSHRQHSSLPASALEHSSHGPDTPAPAQGASRQASFHLDFLIVGGGSSYDSLRTCSRPTRCASLRDRRTFCCIRAGRIGASCTRSRASAGLKALSRWRATASKCNKNLIILGRREGNSTKSFHDLVNFYPRQ